jgi:hypothetical protein
MAWSEEAPALMFAADTSLGPCKILATLGSIRMGVVYRTRDRRQGRDVVIKALSPQS